MSNRTTALVGAGLVLVGWLGANVLEISGYLGLLAAFGIGMLAYAGLGPGGYFRKG